MSRGGMRTNGRIAWAASPKSCGSKSPGARANRDAKAHASFKHARKFQANAQLQTRRIASCGCSNAGADRPPHVPRLPVPPLRLPCAQFAPRIGSTREESGGATFCPNGPSPPPSLRQPEEGKSCPSVTSVLKTWGAFLFPFMNWIRLLDYAAIRADVVAGLTVGVMVIPQVLFAHPPISPICRTPRFPYLTF